MMIDALPCLQYHNTLDDSHIFQHAEVVIHLLTLIVSACILIIYLLFKTLRNSIWKVTYFIQSWHRVHKQWSDCLSFNDLATG